MQTRYRCIGVLFTVAAGIAAARSGPDPPSWHVQLQSASFHHPPLCRRFPYHIAPARDRDLTHLQRVVADLARQLNRAGDTVERGVIVYLRPDGSLRTGTLFNGDFHSVSLTAMPQEDEVIIAAAHTHARGRFYSADQRRLSGEDIELGKRLLSHPRASPGLMLYVIDTSTGTVSEYPARGPCRVNVG